MTNLMITDMYEAYAIGTRQVKLDTAALNVLCLGNSITYHPPLKGDLPGADSLWRGDWGMCASRPEFDYVHQLESMLKSYNENTSVECKNIWEWEQNFAIDKDSLLGEICSGKDLIILNIGENVKIEKEDEYFEAFNSLTEFCLKFTPNVILVGNYWKSPKKEHAVIASARCHNLPYVPIFWIYGSNRERVSPYVGDTICDTHMNPYQIATDFICTHPNDKGMQLIAKSIFNAIICENE